MGRLREKRVRLVATDGALDYLAAKGFDPVFGGRPVRRLIQRELETPLARALLRGDFGVGACGVVVACWLMAF